MPLPNVKEARSFYRAGWQRLDDAQFLMSATRTTGAVYLAGYGVECLLKALVVESVSRANRQIVLDLFRGGRAHDLEWLRVQYLQLGGPPIPASVMEHFTLVNTWSTDLRYRPGNVDSEEAEAFLKAAAEFMRWADGRI
jgi:HEPN domain-containing protein